METKEIILRNYIFSYHKYTYLNEGKIQWSDWINFSPKMIELFNEAIQELKEMKMKVKNNILENGG